MDSQKGYVGWYDINSSVKYGNLDIIKFLHDHNIDKRTNEDAMDIAAKMGI